MKQIYVFLSVIIPAIS